MKFSLPILRTLADDGNPGSLSNKLRARRFQRFEALVATLPRPLRLLDVGGTNDFWEKRGWAGRRDVQIFTVNHVPEEQRHGNITPTTGDATNLSQFESRSFDVAFSNSVIEHLFNWSNQQRMASEIQRVGRTFWVQTPNFWFPIEPHFHVPGWQWIPMNVRVAMIQRWRCGWRGPCPDIQQAQKIVEEVRLLDRSELRRMFPGAALIPERICGIVKSWVVIGGFPGGVSEASRETSRSVR
jgi:hypothetical protein